MKTDTNAHNGKSTNISKLERISGLSWSGILTTFRAVVLVITALIVLNGCWGTDISPSAKMAQKVSQAFQKAEKVEQDIEGVGGDLTQIRKEISIMQTNITQIQNQITQTTNNNESLKSLIITVACVYAGLIALRFVLFIVKAKVAPGSTIKNIMFPWRSAK